MQTSTILKIKADVEQEINEIFSTTNGKKLLEVGFKEQDLCLLVLKALLVDQDKFNIFIENITHALSENLTTKTELNSIAKKQYGRKLLSLYHFFNTTNAMLALRNRYVSLVQITPYKKTEIQRLFSVKGISLLVQNIPINLCNIFVNITDPIILKNVCNAYLAGDITEENIRSIQPHWISETLSAIFRSSIAIEVFKKGYFTLLEASPILGDKLELILTKNGLLFLEAGFTLTEINKMPKNLLLNDEVIKLFKSGIPISICEIIADIKDSAILKNIYNAYSEGVFTKDNVEKIPNKYWAFELLLTIFKNPIAIHVLKKGHFTLAEAAPIPVSILELMFTKNGLKLFENGFTLTEANKMPVFQLENILKGAENTSSTNIIHQALNLTPMVSVKHSEEKEIAKTLDRFTIPSYESPTPSAFPRHLGR